MAQSKTGKNSGRMIAMIAGGVGCLAAVVVIFGIVAALAIPAFLQYVNRAKAAEAHSMVQSLAIQVKADYERDCQFPAAVPPTHDPEQCCGGEMCTTDSSAAKAWEQAGFLAPSEPMYFSYHTERVDPSTYQVRAVQDYQCGGRNHTVILEITAEGEAPNCEAHLLPMWTEHEFQ